MLAFCRRHVSQRRTRERLIGLIVLLTFVVGFVHIFRTLLSPHVAEKYSEYPEYTRNGSRLKTILFWTKYFGSEKWDFDKLGMSPFEHELCHHRCLATTDKTKSNAVDAVLLHYTDIDSSNWPLRLPDHVIRVLVVHEPPPVTENRISSFDNEIHFVMSYRRDSDFYSPYRVIKPIKVTEEARVYRPRVRLAARNRSVAWAVSRCMTASHREKYAQELAKYIDVDVYGACGSKSCPKEEWHSCMEKFATNYKFYLAFENSLCKDYVTEKFFETLRHDVIPVVLGEGDVVLSDHLAPEAYINTRNFKSPKDLADYLWKVSRDEKLFNRYFEWKTKYKILTTHGPLTPGLCRLCDWLNTRDVSQTSKRRHDVSKWWYNDTCDNDFVLRQLTNM